MDMIDEAFISRVRERVEALGGEPVRIATEGGLGRDFIWDLLKGRKKSVNASSLRKLAAALKCDEDWLRNGTDNDDALTQLIGLASNLRPGSLAVLMGTAEALAKQEQQPPEEADGDQQG